MNNFDCHSIFHKYLLKKKNILIPIQINAVKHFLLHLFIKVKKKKNNAITLFKKSLTENKRQCEIWSKLRFNTLSYNKFSNVIYVSMVVVVTPTTNLGVPGKLWNYEVVGTPLTFWYPFISTNNLCKHLSTYILIEKE